jgi:ABC-type siderophore export system fused ATPase/permease subunit
MFQHQFQASVLHLISIVLIFLFMRGQLQNLINHLEAVVVAVVAVAAAEVVAAVVAAPALTVPRVFIVLSTVEPT